MTGKEMVRKPQQAGWVIFRIQGSHHHLQKDGRIVIVPVHGKKALKKGLANGILKKAGLL